MSRSIRAHRYEISVDCSSTLRNYCHFRRRLTDNPDIFLESLDYSEQNQHRCIFNFFLKIFWVGPLVLQIKILACRSGGMNFPKFRGPLISAHIVLYIHVNLMINFWNFLTGKCSVKINQTKGVLRIPSDSVGVNLRFFSTSGFFEICEIVGMRGLRRYWWFWIFLRSEFSMDEKNYSIGWI